MSQREQPIGPTSTELEPNTTDTPAGFSREPADYIPTEHFLTRFSYSHGPKSATRIAPEITGDVVATCIREGALEAGDNGCSRLEAEIDGREWWVVVDIRPDVTNRVVTALVPGVHQTADHNPARRLGGERR